MDNTIPINNVEASLLGRLDVLQNAFVALLQLQAQAQPLAGQQLQQLHSKFMEGLQTAEIDSRTMVIEGGGVVAVQRKRLEQANNVTLQTPTNYGEKGLTETWFKELMNALVENPTADYELVNLIPGLDPASMASSSLAELEDFTRTDQSGIYSGAPGKAEDATVFTLVLYVNKTNRLVYDFATGNTFYFTFVELENTWITHNKCEYFSKEKVLAAVTDFFGNQPWMAIRGKHLTHKSIDVELLRASTEYLITQLHESTTDGRAVIRSNRIGNMELTIPSNSPDVLSVALQGLGVPGYWTIDSTDASMRSSFHTNESTAETPWEKLSTTTQYVLFDALSEVARSWKPMVASTVETVTAPDVEVSEEVTSPAAIEIPNDDLEGFSPSAM